MTFLGIKLIVYYTPYYNLLVILLIMIGIGDMYRQNHKITPYGIEGYKIEKKYQDANKVLKEKNKDSQRQEAKKKQTKRGHYLEDYAKIHGEIPGPGVYNYDVDPWKKSQKQLKKKVKPAKKQTYIEEIMQRQKRLNLPAPGQYKLFKTQEQIKAEKKRLTNRKISVGERCTYLDAVQYEATTTPGVGNYNPVFQRPKSATFLTRNKMIAQTSRPGSTKRKERHPDIGTYNPKIIEDHKSFSRKNKGYHEWGRVDRFKSEEKKSNLGPGAYVFNEKIVGRKNGKSVYYN